MEKIEKENQEKLYNNYKQIIKEKNNLLDGNISLFEKNYIANFIKLLNSINKNTFSILTEFDMNLKYIASTSKQYIIGVNKFQNKKFKELYEILEQFLNLFINIMGNPEVSCFLYKLYRLIILQTYLMILI
jgi:hypothetical protein